MFSTVFEDGSISISLHEHDVNLDGELLPEGVKDSFYGWLTTRNNNGQIIVLENEEPSAQQKTSTQLHGVCRAKCY